VNPVAAMQAVSRSARMGASLVKHLIYDIYRHAYIKAKRFFGLWSRTG
jgi:hypothetical protein